MSNTCDYAEVKIASEFMKMWYFVSMPLVGSAPYDIVVDIKWRLLKVQVKSRGRDKNNKINIHLYTSMRWYRRYYEEWDFDLLAVYDKKTEWLAFIYRDEISSFKSISFSMEYPLNWQKSKIRVFSDYTFSEPS